VPANLRSLRFESKSDAQRWRVFQAVEDVARDAAAQQGLTLASTMNVNHSSGEFHRATVAEAKAVVDRNGYKPWEMWLYTKCVTAAADSTTQVLDPWVSANLLNGSNRVIAVSAQGDNEVEVNGVFALLEAAVDRAKDPGNVAIGKIYLDTETGTSTPGPDHAAPARSAWRGWLGDVSANAVGGVAVVGIPALAGLLWALLR
jgi:hypothetical protein